MSKIDVHGALIQVAERTFTLHLSAEEMQSVCSALYGSYAETLRYRFDGNKPEKSDLLKMVEKALSMEPVIREGGDVVPTLPQQAEVVVPAPAKQRRGWFR